MDKFIFWTQSDLKLHAFDIVKVEHLEGSYTFGVIENISHITDINQITVKLIIMNFLYAKVVFSFQDHNVL